MPVWGVALNCVSNGKLYREGVFENIWTQWRVETLKLTWRGSIWMACSQEAARRGEINLMVSVTVC